MCFLSQNINLCPILKCKYNKTRKYFHYNGFQVRSTLIRDIIIKHKLIKPRVDTGRRKKRPTKKDLEKWKHKRARHLEGWRKKKKKRRNQSLETKTNIKYSNNP
jgi:hypothetical protein